jgi:hypothetical protein
MIKMECPSVALVRGPRLHSVTPTVPENVVDVLVPLLYNHGAKLSFGVKAEKLRRALYKTKCGRTLIFERHYGKVLLRGKASQEN